MPRFFHRLAHLSDLTTDSTAALPQDLSLACTPTERSVTETKSRFAIKQDVQEPDIEIKTHHEIRRPVSPVRQFGGGGMSHLAR